MIVSQSEYEAYANRTFDESDSNLLFILQAAEDIVVDYLGYSPISTTHTTELSGFGTEQIQLEARPITAITSIEIDGVSMDTADFGFKDEFLYTLDGSRAFTEGHHNIEVVYTAGWAEASIPNLIKLVTMKIADILLTDANMHSFSSITTPDGGSRQIVQNINFSKQLEVLHKHKLEVP